MTLTEPNSPGAMTAKMKAIVAVLTIGVVVTVGLLFLSSGRVTDLEAQVATLESERADLQAKLSESQTRLSQFANKQAAAMRVDQELVVAAGATDSYTFSPTMVPGTLSGTWRSSGRGFGGADDTISAFRLTDPKDAVLESSPAGPLSNGRFFVKLSERGAYTFFFDNKGLLRNTPRRVFLEAEFKPD